MAAIRLRTDALSKRYGATVALDGVTISIHEGEVHAILGGIPIALAVAALIMLFWAIDRRTNSGRLLLAVGQDEHAATLSGINVARTRFFSFL